jgi:hypothetical protein
MGKVCTLNFAHRPESKAKGVTVWDSANQKSGYDVTNQSERRLEARHEDLNKRKGHPRDVEVDISKNFPLDRPLEERGGGSTINISIYINRK